MSARSPNNIFLKLSNSCFVPIVSSALAGNSSHATGQDVLAVLTKIMFFQVDTDAPALFCGHFKYPIWKIKSVLDVKRP